eukprot:gb/GEZN01000868.1/.p1 GENE.gb/GEZN01000868.1/~~gb/GEZN01000868.1/.p1  ORF type:complete len:1091 (-),score=165.37 gb/GEZN01000868.1/:293-3082(-)
MAIKRQDSADDVIQEAAKLLQVKTPLEQLALKAVGTEEFFKGPIPIFDYEYTVERVRKFSTTGIELSFVLEEASHVVEQEGVARKLARHQKAYNARLKAVTYPDPSKCVPFRTVSTPFKQHVEGISKCTAVGLPRLDPSTMSLYVKSFIFHGDVIISHSETKTQLIGPSLNPRWSDEEGALKTSIPINQLPRESRIAYLLYGCVQSSSEEDTLLGWVTYQMTDENGIFLGNSDLRLNLWGLPREGAELRISSPKVPSRKEKESMFHRKSSSPSMFEGRSSVPRGSYDLLQEAKLSMERMERSKWTFLFRGTNRDNCASRPATVAVLHVKLDAFEPPIYASLEEKLLEPSTDGVGASPASMSLPKQAQQELAELVKKDWKHELTNTQKELLWRSRGTFLEERKRTQMLGLTSEDFRRDLLPMLLNCVDWSQQKQRLEAYMLLDKWQSVSVSTALQLLDASSADAQVRKFAVDSILRKIPDSDLHLYLLQLTQCIKFEPYHNSPLVRFLIERCIASPFKIGHHLFWAMKAEMETHIGFRERYSLVIEEYLAFCPDAAHELCKTETAINKLLRVAELVCQMKESDKFVNELVRQEYHNQLKALNASFFNTLPDGGWHLPLSPKLKVTTLLVERCRFMSSKKVPLWLVFKNADKYGAPVEVLLKSGDDLRQDMLTLQLLTVMDSIWQRKAIDLHINPYAVVATGVNKYGDGVGMIQAIVDADTTSSIQMKFGGGILGALSLKPLREFILKHNPSEQEQALAMKNFTRSCAGYCVATYVLGIGDRHNGNIMVAKSGHLFHIDFGHFLGNFKTKFGLKRERTPFVFTKEMAYVITNGNKKLKEAPEYKAFEDLCTDAFNTLREAAESLEALFVLMVSAGMPELMVQEDIGYLREMLLPDQSEVFATQHFKQQLEVSVADQWRRWDNAAHLAKHRG